MKLGKQQMPVFSRSFLLEVLVHCKEFRMKCVGDIEPFFFFFFWQ